MTWLVVALEGIVSGVSGVRWGDKVFMYNPFRLQRDTDISMIVLQMKQTHFIKFKPKSVINISRSAFSQIVIAEFNK